MVITYRNLGQCGRLGNSVWEIAATIGIARAHDDEPSFPAWDYQPYFNAPKEFFTSKPGTEATEFVPHLDPRARPYLQDLSLFAAIEEEIREYFQPSELARETLSGMDAFNALPRPILSVHVRRGDNVQRNDPGTPNKRLYHPLRSLDYYRQAIKSVADDVASVAVFSDDPSWCEANLTADYFHSGTPRAREFESAYFIDPILDWIDLALMARCDRHVLSNSSYAWWGAFLSEDRAPIYPSNWFGPLVLEYTDPKRMMPPTWVEMFDLTEADPTCY